MKTVLVTGAGGYIGSVLVPKLLSKGYKVKALDRFFFGKDKLAENENLELVQEDSRKIKEDVFYGVDFVIDLVAISNDPSGELYSEPTWQINHQSRVRTATLAKQHGVKRYILPSSCSIYGFQDGMVDETASTNPLTVYAKANEKAEHGVLPLASDDFTAIVIRQATVFGYSPRMRFDLAVNGMTLGAWKNKKLPLMRDGEQMRPMVHVQDTTDVMCLLLEADKEKVNEQIFNVGSQRNNYKIGQLGEEVAGVISKLTKTDVGIEWYGDPDHRSYNVCFDKIESTLGWKAKYDAIYGATEIVEKLEAGEVDATAQTNTLNWYKELVYWREVIKNIEMYNGVLAIEGLEELSK